MIAYLLILLLGLEFGMGSLWAVLCIAGAVVRAGAWVLYALGALR